MTAASLLVTIAFAAATPVHEPVPLRTLDDRHLFAAPTDLDAWRSRADRLRRQILVAAGLFPLPWRTPLDPVIHSPVDRGDYTVSKVFFVSLPGFFVTGNLYRPTTPGPHPGVLSPHGHWAGGRFQENSEAQARKQIEAGAERLLPNARYVLQARCAALARVGCVVFHYDMVGYADSRQVDHRGGFGDVQAELHSLNGFGLQTWNSIRALDFLESLEDVDASRIGVTGASGGGTQTFILCAIDERPKAAFPAVMVSNAMQGGCVCENASHLRVGTDNVEFAALFAPRPLAMSGANDWTLEIEQTGLPPLRELYRLFDRERDVTARCWPEYGHNYNVHSREMMVRWFLRHLDLPWEEPYVEAELDPIPPGELTVFDGSHPHPDPAVGVSEVRSWFLAQAGLHRAQRRPHDAAALRRFRTEVGGALEILLHRPLPDGLDPAGTTTLRMPDDWNGTVIVTPGDPPDVGRAALLQVDPAFSAEDRRPPVDERRHGQFVGYTLGYNPTRIAWQVADLLAAVRKARELPGCERVSLLGLGESGPLVLLARALLDDEVDRTVAEWSWSFEEIESLDDPHLLPGALRFGGLPAFSALAAPGELRLVGLEQVPDLIRSSYAAAGAADAVRAVARPDPAELLRWLADSGASNR